MSRSHLWSASSTSLGLDSRHNVHIMSIRKMSSSHGVTREFQVKSPDSVEHRGDTGARPHGGPLMTTRHVHIDGDNIEVHEQHPSGEALPHG
jgi:hypothetical protein